MTRRDQRILHAVGRMGQATTEQLLRLFFTERSTACRRLAKLAALRLLDVHVRDLAKPNIYTLACAGFGLLRTSGADPAELHVSRVGRYPDAHLQAINDLRVELVLATRADPWVMVEAFHSDLDLRRAAGSSPPTFIPDAVVELVTPAGPLVLVVEVDLGTESRRVFARKVDHTVSLWGRSLPCWGAKPGSWRPALFVESEGRARSLARVIVERGGGPLWLVGELPRLRERGAVGITFSTADDVARVPLESPISYRLRLGGTGERVTSA